MGNKNSWNKPREQLTSIAIEFASPENVESTRWLVKLILASRSFQ